MNSYDDRIILQTAAANRGIVVSNDKYRDLFDEDNDFKHVITYRLLPYVFSEDIFLPPSDPMGQSGPNLDDFLKISRQEMQQYPHSQPKSVKLSARSPPRSQPPLQQQQHQHRQHFTSRYGQPAIPPYQQQMPVPGPSSQR